MAALSAVKGLHFTYRFKPGPRIYLGSVWLIVGALSFWHQIYSFGSGRLLSWRSWQSRSVKLIVALNYFVSFNPFHEFWACTKIALKSI